MTPKVENYIGAQRNATRSISVERGVRACVNCIWYEQYCRQNRGNIAGWVPTSHGYCLLHDCQRGALRQPCKDFEREEGK